MWQEERFHILGIKGIGDGLEWVNLPDDYYMHCKNLRRNDGANVCQLQSPNAYLDGSLGAIVNDSRSPLATYSISCN